ncbi:MAG: ATP-binding cassette domain-containing protein [Blautia sp.]|nr:ATP-binding cassette domain-containing protein [Blautia sp.]
MKKKDRADRNPPRLWAVLFWLALWQIASIRLNNRILLVSPETVILRLIRLASGERFWFSIAMSFQRIACGFLLGVLTGILIAGCMAVSRRAEELWTPILLVIRSVPVASFIILALVWISSRYLSVFITFLMVFPIICTNTLEGIRACDPKLKEMAEVFCVPHGRRLRYLTVPQIFPYFYSGCRIALGLSWKAGISAEVIGMPAGTIGERLQQAKVYLDTPDMYAWTLVIILVSFLTEKAFLAVLEAMIRLLQMMPETGTGDRPAIREEAETAVFELTEVEKQFGSHKVLEHFSVVFPTGAVAAVMAPSGAGKTTLLRILAGLETADSGEVHIPYTKIGMLFQENRLIENLSGESNIRLIAPWYSREETSVVLREIGLPGGSGQPVREYSGGMKRRVALLRTILSDSRLLLLDEPFQGLDEESKKKTAAWINSRRHGRTMILVTHDEADAKLLQAVSVIELG